MNQKSFLPSLADCELIATSQSSLCANYTFMHYKTLYFGRLVRSNSYFLKYSLPRYKPWIIEMVIRKISSICLPLKGSAPTRSYCTPTTCGSGCLDSVPPDKQQNFYRMSGSPGDSPGAGMHLFITKRVTPFINRLVSDPTGKEAGWETNIGDTKHVNQHIN